jgi:branched-chain amino acid transport system substrate-binding protein
VVVLGLSLAAAGCGGSTERPFKIGVLTACYGEFGGVLRESSVSSAEAPFLERGARPLGGRPSDGVTDVSVAGRRVEFLQGCVSGNPDVIPEARRLVEEDGADAIVGALDPQNGLVLANYAAQRPEQVFLVQPSGAPELTLSHPAPNIYRFSPAATQTVAGLGTYAYRVLGWRKAITVADENPYGFARVGGFVAEFCALGGTVVDKRWLPLDSDSSAAAAGVGTSADGVFFGASLSSAAGLLTQLTSLHRNARRLVVAGDDILTFDPSPLAEGIVVAGSLPPRPNRTGREVFSTLQEAFPSFRAADALSSTAVPYRDGVEAVLEGLEHAHGDTGRLRAALGTVVLASPSGTIHVDAYHQAIVSAYLSRVVVRHGKLQAQPLSVRTVGQRFNGYFGDPTPPFTKTTPACVRQQATP